ncbi:Uncharacterised protein [Legionella busanensis]|uniref:Uncharacterized protein n=1 Tax=Legionella busanensis TaxID=190655 RepID=A0A378JMG9_9GAMM|nr:hypothetical protein [Legionella busanensis]STX52435.1 Uncharacterised protein [Legionella busanensis]
MTGRWFLRIYLLILIFSLIACRSETPLEDYKAITELQNQNRERSVLTETTTTQDNVNTTIAAEVVASSLKVSPLPPAPPPPPPPPPPPDTAVIDINNCGTIP